MAAMIMLLCSTVKAQNNQDAVNKWKEYMTPGEMQQSLAKNEGEWSTATTLWMAPGELPVAGKGKGTYKMILGGRYLEGKHTGSLMDMPFEGIVTYAYDNAKKVFVATWIDNMGTGIMYLEGPWNDEIQAVTFTGKQVNPITGADVPVREVYKIIDDNNHLMELYTTRDGKEFKTMEVKYARN